MCKRGFHSNEIKDYDKMVCCITPRILRIITDEAGFRLKKSSGLFHEKQPSRILRQRSKTCELYGRQHLNMIPTCG